MSQQRTSDMVPASTETARAPRKRTVIMRADHYRLPDAANGGRPGKDPGVYFRCERCGHSSKHLFGMTASAIARGLPCQICNA
ncbi:hypothetical protein LGR54_25580 [Ancylobacter sp. Lp-2]|uniref:hypothetical protein n=1 Tax=Ancylobacter sp. Lp-2 TaxID=2881339 RepID=UPI001E3B413F|nr:hypothetical protein [Ancylobacter sp. Lp-2]MCB4771983.1 hypothetical protein [Ancylobacter sp. Lp-2]